jgi:hypothetical protein
MYVHKNRDDSMKAAMLTRQYSITGRKKYGFSHQVFLLEAT